MVDRACWAGNIRLLPTCWWSEREPRILPGAAGKDDRTEFESYRAAEMSLLKSHSVLMAALRDPRAGSQPQHQAQGRPSRCRRVVREGNSRGMSRSAGGSSHGQPQQPQSERGRQLVNAVVDAYMSVSWQAQQDRLSELQHVAAENENKLRAKREQLKWELETLGVIDDETMKARATLAVEKFAEIMKFQPMRSEQRVFSANSRRRRNNSEPWGNGLATGRSARTHRTGEGGPPLGKSGGDLHREVGGL